METLQSILDEFKLKEHFSIGQVIGFTERCFGEKSSFDELDDDGNDAEQPTRADAIKLAREVVLQPTSGTPDHYHNYAVAFARLGEFDIACDVLLRGLERYKANIDLLSDYLVYAIKSSKDEHYKKCEEIFDTLQLYRPQFWNWRAYDFSIDYLLDKIDRGLGEPFEIRQQCLAIAKEFQKRIHDSELGYIAEGNVYSRFGEANKEMAILKKALIRTDLHAVQSAIALTEIYIKRNNPQEALQCVKRVLSDFPDINARTTPSRVYVLSVISKTAQLLSGMHSNPDHTIDKELAKEILDDWDNVKKFSVRDQQYFDTAKSLVKLVEVISGIKQDDDGDL